MIATRARLAFKVMTLGCLLVGAALSAAGLLGTVAPLLSAFGRLDAPLPSQSPDNSVRSGFALTLAGVTLLEIAAIAGLAWGGFNFYLRRTGSDRQADQGEGDVLAALSRAGRLWIVIGALLLVAAITAFLVGWSERTEIELHSAWVRRTTLLGPIVIFPGHSSHAIRRAVWPQVGGGG
jgi:hypothetical protein